MLPSVFAAVFTLSLSAGDVLLAVRLWHAAPRSRGVLNVWLAVAGLISLAGVVTSVVLASVPSLPFLTLAIAEVALCAAALVLLRLEARTAWRRGRSVSPAGPGLQG